MVTGSGRASSMSTKTRVSGSSTISVILPNSRATSFPDSLNHLLNRLCALTSISSACRNLRGGDARAASASARDQLAWREQELIE